MHRLCFTTSDTAIPTYIVDEDNLLQFEVPSFKRVSIHHAVKKSTPQQWYPGPRESEGKCFVFGCAPPFQEWRGNSTEEVLRGYGIIIQWFADSKCQRKFG